MQTILNKPMRNVAIATGAAAIAAYLAGCIVTITGTGGKDNAVGCWLLLSIVPLAGTSLVATHRSTNP